MMLSTQKQEQKLKETTKIIREGSNSAVDWWNLVVEYNARIKDNLYRLSFHEGLHPDDYEFLERQMQGTVSWLVVHLKRIKKNVVYDEAERNKRKTKRFLSDMENIKSKSVA